MPKISRATFSGNREQILNRSCLTLTADRMHFPALGAIRFMHFFRGDLTGYLALCASILIGNDSNLKPL